MELDCSSSKFKQIGEINNTLEFCTGLCYIPQLNCVVLSGTHDEDSEYEVRAVSCRDSSVLWSVPGISGRKWNDPRALFFLGKLETLLLADKQENVIYVMDPNNGSCIQSMKLENMGEFWKIGVYDNQIITVHEAEIFQKNLSVSKFIVASPA